MAGRCQRDPPLPACPLGSPSASQQTSSTTSLGIKVTLSPLPTSCRSFALKQKRPTPHQALKKGRTSGSPSSLRAPSCPEPPARAAELRTPPARQLPSAGLQESHCCSVVWDARLKPLAGRGVGATRLGTPRGRALAGHKPNSGLEETRQRWQRLPQNTEGDSVSLTREWDKSHNGTWWPQKPECQPCF